MPRTSITLLLPHVKTVWETEAAGYFTRDHRAQVPWCLSRRGENAPLLPNPFTKRGTGGRAALCPLSQALGNGCKLQTCSDEVTRGWPGFPLVRGRTRLSFKVGF